MSGKLRSRLDERGLPHVLPRRSLEPVTRISFCYLKTQDNGLPQACIDQALRVRPHEGQVLFEAANQAELDGDKSRAMQLRQQCFAECPSERGRVLNVLLPMMSAVAVAVQSPVV